MHTLIQTHLLALASQQHGQPEGTATSPRGKGASQSLGLATAEFC